MALNSENSIRSTISSQIFIATKLIIEADGSIHELEDNKQYDAERDEAIVSLGITVLRFTNEDSDR